MVSRGRFGEELAGEFEADAAVGWGNWLVLMWFDKGGGEILTTGD